MEMTDLDPGKIATVAVEVWDRLDTEQRAVVTAAVHKDNGFVLAVELRDENSVTVSMAGVPVAVVAAWRLLPGMPPADA